MNHHDPETIELALE